MSSDSARIVEKLYRAYLDESFPDALACLHPDVVVNEAQSLPYAGNHIGRTGFGSLMGAIASIFDATLHDYDILDAGELVIARLSITFKSRKTGVAATMSVVELHKVVDSLITRIDVFYQDTKVICDLAA